MKRVLSALLCLSALLICIEMCSCTKHNTDYVGRREEGCYGYKSVFFDIPVVDECKVLRANVFLDDEYYCIPVLYSNNENHTLITKVYTVSLQGDLVNLLELEGDMVLNGKVGDNYGWFSYNDNAAYIIDKNGRAVDKIEPGFQSYGCCFTTDGLWFYNTNEYKFFPIGKNKGIEIEANIRMVDGEQPVIELNGDYYIVEDLVTYTKYYKVNLKTGAIDNVCSSYDFEIPTYLINGRYYIANRAIYALDLEKKDVYQIGNLNDIDTRPPLKVQYMGEYVKFVNDDLFFKVFSYTDGSGEVQLYEYDRSINYSSKTVLTIGGYGLSYDAPLNMAIYLFNKSNIDYRINTIDYYDEFAFDDRSDYQQSLLKLMNDFESGSCPDIFYGSEFDYEYMGQNGMVIDLLEENTSIDANLLSESIKDSIIDEDGHCYQIFPSYTINGYWGSACYFDDNESITIGTLAEISESNNLPIYNHVYTENLADTIIRYPIKELWGIGGTAKRISQDKMEDIVEYCIKNSNPMEMQSQIVNTNLDGCLISEFQIGGLDFVSFLEKEYKAEVVYLGFPSIEDSVHLAAPKGLIAISAKTNEKEACCNFANILFSEEVQKNAIVNGGIPVSKDVLDDMISYVQNPAFCNDPIWESLVIVGEPVSENTVDVFIKAVDSIDALEFYDWGVSEIIYDEIELHFSQGRTIEETSGIILNRIDQYVGENY